MADYACTIRAELFSVSQAFCVADYIDHGQQHHEEQQRQRSIAALKRRAASLAFHLNPLQATA